MGTREGGTSKPLTRTLLETRVPEREVVARERLFAAAYGELRKMARGLMRRERPAHSLSPTALVHEVYLRLIGADRVDWTDRACFLGIAARAMRQILVDHARERGAGKRGGGLRRVSLDENVGNESSGEFEILDLHAAIEKLEALDPRAARVVELRAFGGLTAEEVAHVLGISKRTADGDWRVARMWLGRELKRGEA